MSRSPDRQWAAGAVASGIPYIVDQGSPTHALIQPGLLTVSADARTCAGWTNAASVTVLVDPRAHDGEGAFRHPAG
jgi:hypothetical protein